MRNFKKVSYCRLTTSVQSEMISDEEFKNRVQDAGVLIAQGEEAIVSVDFCY